MKPLFELEEKKVKKVKTIKVDKRVERDYNRRVTKMNKDFFDVRIEEIKTNLEL